MDSFLEIFTNKKDTKNGVNGVFPDGPSPLNRDTTVMLAKELITSESSGCQHSCFVSKALQMVGINYF